MVRHHHLFNISDELATMLLCVGWGTIAHQWVSVSAHVSERKSLQGAGQRRGPGAAGRAGGPCGSGLARPSGPGRPPGMH